MVCRTARALLVCSVALCFVNTASVYGTTITVGAPAANGNIIFQAFDSALIIVDQKTGMVINITKGPDTGNIPVTVPGDTANTKAAKIATALGKLANVTKSAAAANVVSVNGTFLGIKGRDLGTGETTTIGLAANGDPPGLQRDSYGGCLSGIVRRQLVYGNGGSALQHRPCRFHC